MNRDIRTRCLRQDTFPDFHKGSKHKDLRRCHSVRHSTDNSYQGHFISYWLERTFWEMTMFTCLTEPSSVRPLAGAVGFQGIWINWLYRPACTKVLTRIGRAWIILCWNRITYIILRSTYQGLLDIILKIHCPGIRVCRTCFTVESRVCNWTITFVWAKLLIAFSSILTWIWSAW